METMTKTEKDQCLTYDDRLKSYPHERLKEHQTSLRLAQALHQKLHTESNIVVNVRKLQRFIQSESTQLSLTAQGIAIQSMNCNEPWCSTLPFNIILDLGYIHDELLLSNTKWLDPHKEGVFKGDPILEEELEMIALTFDDGPNLMTMKLVDILGASNVKATFFLIGSEVEANPAFAKHIHSLGHEIGNHTYSHPHLTQLSLNEITYEMDRTDVIIEDLIGVKPTIMRPPYGEINQENLEAFSHRVIQWSLDTVDWHHHDKTIILDILNNAIDGDIILMHDRYEHTQEAVKSFIQKQHALGIQFVSVSQLIQSKHYKSRIVHGVRTPINRFD